MQVYKKYLKKQKVYLRNFNKNNLKVSKICNTFAVSKQLKTKNIMYYYYPFANQELIGELQDFVDLGLPSGLKWAKCNVGAKTPTDFGNYFRWGEVVDARGMGNYLNYDYSKPFEDAATYHMGGAWRMPTTEEFKELYDNTTNKWVEDYQGTGVIGRLFTSNVNGQTLFFPAAGYYFDSSCRYVGSRSYVWSSSVNTSNPYAVHNLYFNSSAVYPQYDYNRRDGFSVRGVRY